MDTQRLIEKKLRVLVKKGLLPKETLNTFQHFTDKDLETLNECLSDMLREGRLGTNETKSPVF